MTARRSLALVVALGAVLAFAVTADAQERMKHSGTIVAIDHLAGTIVLAEIGPWKLRDGNTVITYRTIVLTPETEVAIAGRDHATLDGWPGEFIEGELGPDALYLNDHVTVDCLHQGTRFIALKITVTAGNER